MSFNEKLQKLRKESKYSQEELADKLDVTRQSVSKWESGQTYPEMDKLLAMCKIFGCSLEDLTNDEIKEITTDKKNNFSSIVDSSLNFVGKTYKMITAMKFKEILKCFITMLIVGISLLVLYIPIALLNEAFRDLFYSISGDYNSSTYFLLSLISLILNCAYIAIYIMLFVYIFKIGFLDKYEFINPLNLDKIEKQIKDIKTTEEKISMITNEAVKVKEDKIFIRESRDYDYKIFDGLGKIVMFFVKAFLVFFSLPFFGFLIFLSAALVISIYLIFQGVCFVGVLLFIISGGIGCILFLEFIANILFNRKHSYKRMLITLLAGVAGLGISGGITFLEISSIKYYDEVPPTATKTNESFEVAFKDDMIIYFENFEIDDSLVDRVIIEVEYYNDFERVFISSGYYDNHVEIYLTDDGFNTFKRFMELSIESLKKREFYNYNELYRMDVVIRSSSANIDQIRKNILEESRIRIEEQTYYNRINELQNRIYELENDISVCDEYTRNSEDS